MAEQLAVLRALWLTGSPPPIIFSRAANPTDAMAALHAKLLICDSTFALVTSANFSHHGLHEYFEIGVKIQSEAVERLVEFLQAMIRMGEVDPVAWN
jgi:phosphatidylserine/phosphatidylglycerophosphate/cardiolipin synthase-like enzyme